MLRDPIFKKVIGKMMSKNIAPDSFIKLVTNINLVTKVNVLKTLVRCTEIIGEEAGEKVNFQEAILWLLR